MRRRGLSENFPFARAAGSRNEIIETSVPSCIISERPQTPSVMEPILEILKLVIDRGQNAFDGKMIDLMRESSVLFIDQAIFAVPIRPLDHGGSKRIRTIGHGKGSVGPWPWPISECVPTPKSVRVLPFHPETDADPFSFGQVGQSLFGRR